jgi:hypothetical protein
MQEIIQQLLDSPETQLDNCIKTHITDNWVDLQPTALQLLEVLDRIVRYSLASDFVVNILTSLLIAQIDEEDTTMEDVVAQAEWRKVLK